MRKWLDDRLRQLGRGKGKSGLAKALGLHPARITEMINGTRSIKATEIPALARYLEMDETDVLRLTLDAAAAPARNVAQVVGYVGAGAEIYPIDDHAIGNGLEEVDCPDSLAGKPVVAVRVRGDSMLPMMHDGWLLFYSRDHDGVPEDCVGRVCVVKVAGDGPTYVKQVRRGYTPGHYNLVSTNAQQIEDVALAWAARVLMILPS